MTSRTVLAILLLSVPMRAWADDSDGGDHGLSTTNTSFEGARLLHVGAELTLGDIAPMGAGDVHVYHQGDTVFADLIGPNENKVSMVLEAFWFMSSLERNADDYIIVVKLNSAPAIGGNWGLVTQQSDVDKAIHGTHEVAQRLTATAPADGSQGSVRWDWSIPYQTYRWEPAKVVQIEQLFSAGLGVQGSFMKDLTTGANVQANGNVSADYRASTNYTITLYRWEMRVSTAGSETEWGLVPLDPEKKTDNAYHEYFIVVQGATGQPVRLDGLTFGGEFRQSNVLTDSFERLDATVPGIQLVAPPKDSLCPPDQMLDGSKCTQRPSPSNPAPNAHEETGCATAGATSSPIALALALLFAIARRHRHK